MVRVWCPGKGRQEKGYSQIVITHHLLHKVLRVGVVSRRIVLGDTLLAVRSGF